jgi:hypothetical protein
MGYRLQGKRSYKLQGATPVTRNLSTRNLVTRNLSTRNLLQKVTSYKKLHVKNGLQVTREKELQVTRSYACNP